MLTRYRVGYIEVTKTSLQEVDRINVRLNPMQIANHQAKMVMTCKARK